MVFQLSRFFSLFSMSLFHFLLIISFFKVNSILFMPSYWRFYVLCFAFTAWKMSKYGVTSGPYFPVFSPNTGRYRPEITPFLDTLHAVIFYYEWNQHYLSLLLTEALARRWSVRNMSLKISQNSQENTCVAFSLIKLQVWSDHLSDN